MLEIEPCLLDGAELCCSDRGVRGPVPQNLSTGPPAAGIHLQGFRFPRHTFTQVFSRLSLVSVHQLSTANCNWSHPWGKRFRVLPASSGRDLLGRGISFYSAASLTSAISVGKHSFLLRGGPSQRAEDSAQQKLADSAQMDVSRTNPSTSWQLAGLFRRSGLDHWVRVAWMLQDGFI